MSTWHLVTGEFPPKIGGVSDHSYQIAAGLATAGDEVHVWCPPQAGDVAAPPGVVVHCEAGHFGPRDLRRLGARLDGFPAPRRLLVQWVPHSFGLASLNLAFCWWLRDRVARHGDTLEVIVHEPGTPYERGRWRRNVAAVAHRQMARILMRRAEHVWLSAPEWEVRWRDYDGAATVPFRWLPLPSGIPVIGDAAAVGRVRAELVPGTGRLLGYFGLFQGGVAPLLLEWLPPLLAADAGRVALLIGSGGREFRREFLSRHPNLAGQVHATGALELADVSHHLSACDVLLQPFPGGVNARRSSIVAGLAHGRPIVTTTGPFTEAFWGAADAVVLVPEEASSAVERIETLLGDTQEAERLGAAARELYDSVFDLRHAVGELRMGRRTGPPSRLGVS